MESPSKRFHSGELSSIEKAMKNFNSLKTSHSFCTSSIIWVYVFDRIIRSSKQLASRELLFSSSRLLRPKSITLYSSKPKCRPVQGSFYQQHLTITRLQIKPVV